ncbi:DNA-formamidopyrimidine glycosylase [Spirulina sp. 06S082]|uniref:DNA-formamidopyrimidine glycosylase n=1 Tax=Spirulina sp. 06S082 TaxID=3110248 RepID=UPI002B21AF24|nr:DNA-formamidopyrimidine glycosylase [Spirulina sp. 06S082]MEA5468449.1 DNA-formamidopyrimidine glycosylase [Spirulina sp. 06S082]
MPELPEVETVRRGLNRLTLNQIVQGGEVLLERTLAYPVSMQEFLRGLRGVSITSWQRRGKYLLAPLHQSDDRPGGWLGVHLRMTGQLLWGDREDPLSPHTRVRLFFPEGKELRFVDIRTFGKMWWVPPDRDPETIITGLQKLGPEPLTDNFSPIYLSKTLAKTQRRIKTVLLDQQAIAGLGNIYADEVLFKSGIRPEAIASHLDKKQVDRLHQAIVEVLETAIAKGGTTFSNFLSLLGVPGNYGDTALVYGRKGKPCLHCSRAIERIKIGGRSSHFCPQCQT